jgi:hypothetical protein
MINKHIHVGLIILFTVSLLMAGCSPSQATPSAAPTVDANAIYTQAAQTVQAGQALTQAAKPPTQAPTQAASTPTMDPAMAAGLTATAKAILVPPPATGPTATLQPGAPTPTTAKITPLVLPTATKAVVQPPAATGDKCEWVKNIPADNSSFPKKASFDAIIRVKNSGTTTWDNKYALRYFAGDKMGAPNDYYVQGTVKPNTTYDFKFTMTAPDSTGKKELLMVVQNPDGRNMCFINIPLNITD